MKTEEIRKLPLDILRKNIQEASLAIAKFRAAKKGKQMASSHAFRNSRKTLARLLTIQQESSAQGRS